MSEKYPTLAEQAEASRFTELRTAFGEETARLAERIVGALHRLILRALPDQPPKLLQMFAQIGLDAVVEAQFAHHRVERLSRARSVAGSTSLEASGAAAYG